jgi:hypothetical protein
MNACDAFPTTFPSDFVLFFGGCKVVNVNEEAYSTTSAWFVIGYDQKWSCSKLQRKKSKCKDGTKHEDDENLFGPTHDKINL